jgi:cytochrome c oxidase subunit 2
MVQLDFQNPATSVMEGIIDFHHDVQFYLIIIVSFVAWALFSIVYEFGLTHYLNSSSDLKEVGAARANSLSLNKVTHGTVLEIIWTIIPVFVLIAIAVPSFALLYAIDELIEPSLTVKVVGHQWYWSYEYSDYIDDDLMFDSYMLSEEDLEPGQLRLLEVDRKLWLPTLTHIRILVTASDVIHSWAVPSFGVKMDCLPGRLNQVSLFIKREGVFYGQCSELCGVNHGFMPIAVKAVPIDLFNFWVNFNLNN